MVDVVVGGEKRIQVENERVFVGRMTSLDTFEYSVQRWNGLPFNSNNLWFENSEKIQRSTSSTATYQHNPLTPQHHSYDINIITKIL